MEKPNRLGICLRVFFVALSNRQDRLAVLALRNKLLVPTLAIRESFRRIRIILILIILCARTGESAILAPGEFTAATSCPATLMLQGTNPGDIHLEPGRVYRALALDRRGGDWVRIIIPEARPRVRWAGLDCGEYRTDTGTLRFTPFFDTRANQVYVDYPRRMKQDITPPPPQIDPWEERLLALCGYPGDYPEPGAFRSLIESDSQLLQGLTQALDCPNNDPSCSREMILDRATDLWFLADGFRRVFCGEFYPNRIEGPNYRAAFLQMQRRGWAGLMAPHKGREEIIPGLIYSIGIEHEWRGQRIKTVAAHGYFYSLDARQLLIQGTRAITLLGTPIIKQACRYVIKDSDTQKSFYSVIIGKDEGIKTFYPTALPDRTLRSCQP